MNSRILNVGQVLMDRYHVVKYIDEGGMQQVYQAKDVVFDRTVALKVPKNMSAEKRFDRSAKVSARITHSNVSKTLDYFEDGATSYLVEEFVNGSDLNKLLNKKYLYLDPHLAAHVFYHLVKGVAVAHHANVFHRDLKPSNIMVGSMKSKWAIKVTDFGIAKMAEREIEEAVENETSLQASTTAVGALPYMAPELIDTPKEASKPADVWSVGAILLQLLTGDYPFGIGLRAVPRIMTGKLPDKPALFVRKEQMSELANELWDIASDCLQKEPSKRPTADALVSRCSLICYSDIARQDGTVSSYRRNSGRWGFINTEGGQDVFFHGDSFYGDRISEGSPVCMASYPGAPYPRAFPVLPLRGEGG